MTDYKLNMEEWQDKLNKYPVLSKLYSGYVFTIGETVPGLFKFVEACDNWHNVELTKQEVIDLAGELVDFVSDKEEAT